MSGNLEHLKGIGPKNKEKLNEYGIHTVDDLLKACKTKKDRKKLSEETGIRLKQIEKWFKQAKDFVNQENVEEEKIEETVADVEEDTSEETVEEEIIVEESVEEEIEVSIYDLKFIDEEFLQLMEKAKIKNKDDLLKYKPLDLLEKLHKTNKKYNLARRLPSINQIIRWIEQAKKIV